VPLVYSPLIGFTSCIVKSFRSRRSFISSPLWTPEVYGPTSQVQQRFCPPLMGRGSSGDTFNLNKFGVVNGVPALIRFSSGLIKCWFDCSDRIGIHIHCRRIRADGMKHVLSTHRAKWQVPENVGILFLVGFVVVLMAQQVLLPNARGLALILIPIHQF